MGAMKICLEYFLGEIRVAFERQSWLAGADCTCPVHRRGTGLVGEYVEGRCSSDLRGSEDGHRRTTHFYDDFAVEGTDRNLMQLLASQAKVLQVSRSNDKVDYHGL